MNGAPVGKQTNTPTLQNRCSYSELLRFWDFDAFTKIIEIFAKMLQLNNANFHDEFE